MTASSPRAHSSVTALLTYLYYLSAGRKRAKSTRELVGYCTAAMHGNATSFEFRGCFAFLLYGIPTAKLFASTAAAPLSLLHPRRTAHRVVMLLTEQWWDTPFESTLRGIGRTLIITRR